ncbi:MAG TPA: hypothetical protein VNT76_08065, partial [Candidatus Binatus sp.]|nr:hypothetical protein [Candidatus Binatus sp.]
MKFFKSNIFGREHRSNSLVVRFSIVTGVALIALATVTTMVSNFMERRSLLTAIEKQALRTADLLSLN